MRYADANVQAWAGYYAQGGKDPTGAVYFISVPGVKEPTPPQPAPPQPAATTTVVNQDPNQGQPPSRRQSLEDDLPLQNPYDRYGPNQTPGAGGDAGPGYGASPYYGLTRDVAGMDING